MSAPSLANHLIAAAKSLRDAAGRLRFKPPVTCVYNPLQYAWRAHEMYLRTYADRRKRVLFLGMNPGPFGMVQTGIPFGEVHAVRHWMKIEAPIERPSYEIPKRPVQGFLCRRSEVSGQRLWGLFAERFGPAERFFAEHGVINYCPLAFFDNNSRNLTPDKLPAAQAAPLFNACDEHLRRVIRILEPDWLIGIGDFAAKRALQISGGASLKVGRILHPSPASPAANRDWARQATEQLEALGVW
jgi:single-strand selective monofunctional uracil DNA glycosylase